MDISMSSAQADTLMSEAYRGDSQPLIKNTSVENKQDITSWLVHTKREGSDHERKHAAIHVYLRIAEAAAAQCPTHSFPAVMSFSDGKCRYPDKGLIKAMVSSGYITGIHVGDELVFVVDERWF